MNLRLVLGLVVVVLAGVYFLFGGGDRGKGPLLAFQENAVRAASNGHDGIQSSSQRHVMVAAAPKRRAWYMRDDGETGVDTAFASGAYDETPGGGDGESPDSYGDAGPVSRRPLLEFAGPSILPEEPELRERRSDGVEI